MFYICFLVGVPFCGTLFGAEKRHPNWYRVLCPGFSFGRHGDPQLGNPICGVGGQRCSHFCPMQGPCCVAVVGFLHQQGPRRKNSSQDQSRRDVGMSLSRRPERQHLRIQEPSRRASALVIAHAASRKGLQELFVTRPWLLFLGPLGSPGFGTVKGHSGSSL